MRVLDRKVEPLRKMRMLLRDLGEQAAVDNRAMSSIAAALVK